MLKILTLPNPKLRQKTKKVLKVDKRIERIIKEMKMILEKSESPKGIGLAAPQLGIPLRIILVRFGKTIVPFINPEITAVDGEIIEGFEGCLSVPGIYGYIKRPAIIHLKFLSNYRFDEKGVSSHTTYYILHTTPLGSLSARVIQHEVDHLNGILFVDRILEQKSKFYKIIGKDKDGKEVFEEVKLNL